ncbi:MAG: CotH kinase family protein [Prevotellaceae bacterium]|nr:CotH kinase family protein [Candidatus Minthosoma caballi]
MNLKFKTLLLLGVSFVCGVACAQQQDTDNDGVCNPDMQHPAYGMYVDYERYPQLTNVPTIYLTCDEGVTLDYVNKTETYYSAHIVIVDKNGKMKQRDEAVSFRGRGNSSWNCGSSKKPWRLKFPSRTDLLTELNSDYTEVNNYANAKSWTLLANFFDKSLIRNAVTNELGKMVGLAFFPAYKFVDLVLNGEYYGTYQVSDHMEIAPKRVEIDSETGWFVEQCINNNGFVEDPYFVVDGYYFNIKNPDADVAINFGETTDPKYQEMKAFFSQAIPAAKNGTSGWEQYYDIESLAKFIMCMDITGNYDGAIANDYFWTEATEPKLKAGPLWDLDLGYGNKEDGNKHFWEYQGQGFAYFYPVIYRSAAFQQVFYPMWQSLYNNGGLIESLNDKVDAIYNEVKASAVKNFTEGGHQQPGWREAWSMNDNSYMGKKYSGGTVEQNYANAVNDIKSFISSHLEWLNTQYTNDYASYGPKNPGETGGEDPENSLGLKVVGKNAYFAPNEYGEMLYTYTGTAATMLEGATVEIEATVDNVDLYIGNTIWKNGDLYNKINSFVLTGDDVIKLSQNNYTFSIVVWENGECSSVTLSGGQSQCSINGHAYSRGLYNVNEDGTHSSVCDVCGEVSTQKESHSYGEYDYDKQNNGTYFRAHSCTKCGNKEFDNSNTVYYEFTVFPQSSESEKIIASTWHPTDELPNSIATVKTTPSGAEANIPDSWNIVNKTANADGDNTCTDFRLTDGHPYYSETKFVAAKATYSRRISNAWGTIILPYKFQSASTDHADFYHLSKATIGNTEGTLVFTPIDPSIDGNASAYTPVVFKAKDRNGGTLKVDGENITVKKSSADKFNSTIDGWTLTGSVEPITVNGDGIYYIKNNLFWHATGELTNPAFRAYFTNSNPVSNGVKMFSLAVEGDETGVKNVPLEDAARLAVFVESDGVMLSAVKSTEVAIYGVNGALVHKDLIKAGDEKKVELPAGVYVVNGIKFVIK